MNMFEIAVILLFFVVLLTSYLFNRILVRLIVENVYQLDQNIAEALKNTVEKLPEIVANGEFADPPNPLQMMIAQIIQDRMKPAAVEVTEVRKKGSDGRFLKNEDIS